MPRRLIGGRLPTAEERQLALRIATVLSIRMTLIMIIPLVVAALFWRHEVQTRLNQDRALTLQFQRERIDRSEAINRFVFEQCIQAEIRDVVIVDQLRGAIQRARSTLPAGTAILRTQLQILQDGIAALEPPNETDCVPPPAVKPEGSP